MNVDEAMEAAAEFRADMETRPAWTLFSENVAVVLSFEVERLRAELAAAKAASEAIVSKLRNEIDHATCNDMRLPPMFGQWKGELAVRVGALQAVIDSTTSPAT